MLAEQARALDEERDRLLGSTKRFTWVMYRLALTAKTKPSGRLPAHARKAVSEGIR